MNLILWLTILLTLLVLADGVLTLIVVRNGIGRERNKLLLRVDQWLHEHGWHARWGWLVGSRVFAWVILWGLYAFGVWHRPEFAAALGAWVVVHGQVVFNNWRVLQGHEAPLEPFFRFLD